VYEVKDLAQVSAESVEGVHDDRVAGAGVGEQRGQALSVDGGTGALVGEDPLVGDADGGEGVELALRSGTARVCSSLRGATGSTKS
jgi:hypothetical protein